MNEKDTWKLEDVQDVPVCHLYGHLDASMAGLVSDGIRDLLDGPKTKLLFNLSELSYISSAGLRVFLYAAKKMNAKQGVVSICSPSANVKRILEIASLGEVLSIYQNQDVALTFLN